MNTRNRPAIEPPIFDQTSDSAAINSEDDKKADERPLVHDFQTGMAIAPVLMMIDEAMVVRAILGWQPRTVISVAVKGKEFRMFWSRALGDSKWSDRRVSHVSDGHISVPNRKQRRSDESQIPHGGP